MNEAKIAELQKRIQQLQHEQSVAQSALAQQSRYLAAPEASSASASQDGSQHTEDAIQADVDAICTGEGEFAFDTLYGALTMGRDPTVTQNFWFKDRKTGAVKRNPFLPLMSSEEMEEWRISELEREAEALLAQYC